MGKDSAMNEESLKENCVYKPARPDGNAASPDKDLSREIERMVDREPLDLVKCVRVFGNYYRCNWWSSAGSQSGHSDANWSRMIVDIVRKSCFLIATMDAGKLVMKEIIAAGASRSKAIRDPR
jgi:hypothetical protein